MRWSFSIIIHTRIFSSKYGCCATAPSHQNAITQIIARHIFCKSHHQVLHTHIQRDKSYYLFFLNLWLLDLNIFSPAPPATLSCAAHTPSSLEKILFTYVRMYECMYMRMCGTLSFCKNLFQHFYCTDIGRNIHINQSKWRERVCAVLRWRRFRKWLFYRPG